MKVFRSKHYHVRRILWVPWRMDPSIGLFKGHHIRRNEKCWWSSERLHHTYLFVLLVFTYCPLSIMTCEIYEIQRQTHRNISFPLLSFYRVYLHFTLALFSLSQKAYNRIYNLLRNHGYCCFFSSTWYDCSSLEISSSSAIFNVIFAQSKLAMVKAGLLFRRVCGNAAGRHNANYIPSPCLRNSWAFTPPPKHSLRISLS